MGPQRVRVLRADLGPREGELAGVVAERQRPGVEVTVAVVVLGMRRKLVWGALGTEVVCMRANSVMAVVLTRDDDGEQLTLLAR